MVEDDGQVSATVTHTIPQLELAYWLMRVGRKCCGEDHKRRQAWKELEVALLLLVVVLEVGEKRVIDRDKRGRQVLIGCQRGSSEV